MFGDIKAVEIWHIDHKDTQKAVCEAFGRLILFFLCDAWGVRRAILLRLTERPISDPRSIPLIWAV